MFLHNIAGVKLIISDMLVSPELKFQLKEMLDQERKKMQADREKESTAKVKSKVDVEKKKREVPGTIIQSASCIVPVSIMLLSKHGAPIPLAIVCLIVFII